MRAADREQQRRRFVAIGVILLAWWFPTIVLSIGGFALQVVGIRIRLWRVERLIAARQLDEADRVLRRLRIEIARL